MTQLPVNCYIRQLTGLLTRYFIPMEEVKIEEIPFLSNIGLMLTYKCTIACPHCIVKAGPNRKEEMTLESAFNWFWCHVNFDERFGSYWN